MPVSVNGQASVRYWAAARSAAGVDGDVVDAGTLDDVVRQVLRIHRDRERFADVIDACSILVAEVPVGARDHGEVVVRAGDSVEFLPPFAGG
ncbi:MoaD/ThiS family protein [soil metagenome]